MRAAHDLYQIQVAMALKRLAEVFNGSDSNSSNEPKINPNTIGNTNTHNRSYQ